VIRGDRSEVAPGRWVTVTRRNGGSRQALCGPVLERFPDAILCRDDTPENGEGRQQRRRQPAQQSAPARQPAARPQPAATPQRPAAAAPAVVTAPAPAVQNWRVVDVTGTRLGMVQAAGLAAALEAAGRMFGADLVQAGEVRVLPAGEGPVAQPVVPEPAPTPAPAPVQGVRRWVVVDLTAAERWEVGTVEGETEEQAREAAGEQWGFDQIDSGDMVVEPIDGPATSGDGVVTAGDEPVTQPEPVAAPEPEPVPEPAAEETEYNIPLATTELVSPWQPPVTDLHRELAAKHGDEMVKLGYDIPDLAEGVESPRVIYRMKGFWPTDSEVCIKRKDIDLGWIDRLNREIWRLRQAGLLRRGKWSVIPVDPRAVPQLLADAECYFQERIREERASLLASIESANRQLDNAQRVAEEAGEEFDRAKAVSYYQSRCKSRIKAAERVIGDFQAAADAFGLVSRVGDDVSRTATACRGMTAYYAAKAAAFAQLKELAKGTSMEAAAEAGEIPDNILADFLTDEGKNTGDYNARFAK
jgi:hypothetical protein